MQKITRCKKNRGWVGSMLMALAMVITLLTGIKTTSVEASQPAPVKQFADLKVDDVLSSGDVIQLPNHGECTENSGKPFLVYEIKNGKGYTTTVSCNGTYTIPQSEGMNVKYVVTKCVDFGKGNFPCGELDLELELSTYAVTVQDDGNGTASASVTEAAEGTAVMLTAAPNSGYQFKEWEVVSGDVTVEDNAFTMPGNDVTVKAVFEKIPVATYAVTVETDGNGTASASVTAAAGGTVVTLTANPNSGYQFKEWQVVSGGITVSGNTFTMPETDVTVKAVFEKQNSNVKQFADLKVGDVLSSGDVIQLPNHVNCTGNTDKPFQVGYKAAVDDSYEIVYFSHEEDNGRCTILQMNGQNVKYKVMFLVDNGAGSWPCGKLLLEQITYAVTVQNDGNGTASASVTDAAEGVAVTLTATPNSGYQFKKWEVVSGDVTVENNAFTMPGNDVTVKAVFEKIPAATYAVTVQNDGNGTASASVASAAEGTAVTLTATPNSGYQFKKWEVVSGGVTVRNNAFTMPGNNVTVKAVFEKTLGQGTVTGGTEQGNGAPAASLNNSAEDLKNKVLTAQEQARVSAGENARVYLEVNDSSSTVSAADKTLIQEKLGGNVLGLYLDISLYKQLGTDAAQKVTAPNGKISISIKIPDRLINKDSTKTRTYQMVRVHDGAAAVIEGTYDTATKLFTFKTDAFSTYALVYQDTAEGNQNSTTTTTTDNQAAAAPASVKDDVPKTGDVSTVAFWLFLVAVSGAGVLCFGKKKRAIEK